MAEKEGGNREDSEGGNCPNSGVRLGVRGLELLEDGLKFRQCWISGSLRFLQRCNFQSEGEGEDWRLNLLLEQRDWKVVETITHKRHPRINPIANYVTTYQKQCCKRNKKRQNLRNPFPGVTVWIASMGGIPAIIGLPILTPITAVHRDWYSKGYLHNHLPNKAISVYNPSQGQSTSFLLSRDCFPFILSVV